MSSAVKNLGALCATLTLLLPIQAVRAASFDCAKASTKVEHLICDNPEISKLDEELARRYKIVLRDKTKAATVKQEQKEWMHRRNHCLDELCVRRAYLGRKISLLDRPPTPEEEFELARYEIGAFGRGDPFCEQMLKRMNDELRSNPSGPICVYDILKTMPGVTFPEWKEIDLHVNKGLYKRFARANGHDEADLEYQWVQAVVRRNRLYLWADIFPPPGEKDVLLIELSEFYLAYPQEGCANFKATRFSGDLGRAMPQHAIWGQESSRWPFRPGSDKAIHVIINGQESEVYENLSEVPQLSNGFSLYSQHNKIQCSISGNFYFPPIPSNAD